MIKNIKVIQAIFVAFVVFFSTTVSSEILVYEFKDTELELRFNHLTQILRCPKCQNNNLADSNAPLAVDLKDIIYEKLHQGQSDEQIIGFLKERYGDFISYKPPLRPSTWLIWFGPFIILVVGVILIIRFVAGRKNEASSSVSKVDDSVSGESILSEWKEELETGNSQDINEQTTDKNTSSIENNKSEG